MLSALILLDLLSDLVSQFFKADGGIHSVICLGSNDPNRLPIAVEQGTAAIAFFGPASVST